jgi:hypothetical protein
MLRGAVPLSMDLSCVMRVLRYRYRLFQCPQGLVERNPVICSGQLVFRGAHGTADGLEMSMHGQVRSEPLT